jgi:hypothetical protein
VEGHADEAGAGAGVEGGGVPHGLPDDHLRARARALVEAEPEWTPRWRSLGRRACGLSCRRRAAEQRNQDEAPRLAIILRRRRMHVSWSAEYHRLVYLFVHTWRPENDHWYTHLNGGGRLLLLEAGKCNRRPRLIAR